VPIKEYSMMDKSGVIEKERRIEWEASGKIQISWRGKWKTWDTLSWSAHEPDQDSKTDNDVAFSPTIPTLGNFRNRSLLTRQLRTLNGCPHMAIRGTSAPIRTAA
jgi:hypothetical protein